MEMLMQYMWEHRLWGARELATNDGRRVRVIDPGRRNTDAGPDFFNAKVRIDGTLWVCGRETWKSTIAPPTGTAMDTTTIRHTIPLCCT